MTKIANNSTLKEGIYEVVCGDRYVVQVLNTLQGQFPCTKEVLMAHFMSGAPRFPMPVRELTANGGTFNLIK